MLKHRRFGGSGMWEHYKEIVEVKEDRSRGRWDVRAI